ncbi:hypothetical protein ACKTEK_13985 [Tepidamorphus sp. 3E244]|uniref:hypothetical protein n=1 Tax=Tepidamorphus sp. 3E244 TaxID=3385498 RepID=UPI0038FC30C4
MTIATKYLTTALAGLAMAGLATAASAECNWGHKTSMVTAENASPVPETKPGQQTATAETVAEDATLETAQAPQDTATE